MVISGRKMNSVVRSWGMCEPQVPSAQSFKTVPPCLRDGVRCNPTCAGPCLCRNTCSNSQEVRSQRRRVTNGDEGARQVQLGRCHVSASAGCHALSPAEALGGFALLTGRDTGTLGGLFGVLGGVA